MTLEKVGKIQTNYLNAQVVKSNKNKVVITDDVKIEVKPTNFGDRLHLSVKCGDEVYTWTPNNSTMDSLIDELGADESKWIGNEVVLSVVKVQTSDGIKDAIFTKAYADSQ